ncbi:MAG: hypothetical protein DWQ02_06665 [Bacteroidetes bacterium]|nr:MAG: hypothetical protein DWQ02_06665 [Bacteroidota bacterium]
MKILRSLPSNKDFFDTYAPLSRNISRAGIFAQLVSGMTELGIIYTGMLQAMKPLDLGVWESVLAAMVAVVGTVTIELGLRQAFPKAIDSILHTRWSGLHLPISVFVWLLSIVLMVTSGLLSFKNSYVIVDNFTPQVIDQTTAEADSIYREEETEVQALYKQDSLMIENTFRNKTEAITNSLNKKVESEERAIVGYENREARTNQSYATRKDRIRQNIANLEAAKADSLAILTTLKANDLFNLKTNYNESLAYVKTNHQTAVNQIVNDNKQAKLDREATVNSYGGGLGWFTVVCLFLFAVSVILDRIYRKGAGINESIQIEAYDFRPSALREWWSSIWERINYLLHNKIKSFADKTPAAPLPVQPGVVYDMAEAMQHVTVKLQLDQDNNTGKVISLETKQPESNFMEPTRTMGFKQQNPLNNSCDLYSPRTTKVETTKNGFETVDLRQAKQRLKRYKKRLGSHQQKAIKQQQATGKVVKRTANAIENNKKWVEYWEDVISSLSKG